MPAQLFSEAKMTTKDRLMREIDQLDEDELQALFALIQEFLAQRVSDDAGTFLERLSNVQIDGPVDFAQNLDLYLAGE